jgi:hypothetical protein
MIQNQSGGYLKKWDKSGVVVETKAHDQYVVKVAGTGRLTLRNRRFLRRYSPHHTQGQTWQCASPKILEGSSSRVPVRSMEMTPQVSQKMNPVHDDINTPQPLPPTDGRKSPSSIPDDLHVKSPEIPNKETDSSDSAVAHSPEVVYTASRLSFGDLDVPQSISTDSDPPTNVCMQPVRLVRIRKARQFYNASTGTYTIPSIVSDDI